MIMAATSTRLTQTVSVLATQKSSSLQTNSDPHDRHCSQSPILNNKIKNEKDNNNTEDVLGNEAISVPEIAVQPKDSGPVTILAKSEHEASSPPPLEHASLSHHPKYPKMNLIPRMKTAQRIWMKI